MMFGAAAFFVYSCVTAWIIARLRLRAGIAAFSALCLWFVSALGGWFLFGR